jgi:hypothetical protein
MRRTPSGVVARVCINAHNEDKRFQIGAKNEPLIKGMQIEASMGA